MFIAERQTELVKTRAYAQYCDVYKVSQDCSKHAVYPQSCDCNICYEIKVYETAAQTDRNPEMEAKIKEIQSLYFQ